MADFEALVRFLVKPFLESPDSLKLDCERLAGGKRLVIRVAFDGEDKGRVFGRGGRNIQAIRNVVKATAKMSDCAVHIDVFGEPSEGSSDRGGSRPRGGQRPRGRGPNPRSRRRS